MQQKQKKIPAVYLRITAVVILFALLKQLMVMGLPIHAISGSVADDELMVRNAEYLLNGQWLGPYDQYTFVKGMFFPLFLAFSKMLPISYISFSTLCYTIGCLIFLASIRPILKKEWQFYAIYLVLLFNPASLSWTILQRVYRNGVTLWQVLIVIGSIMGIYLRRKQKPSKLVGWALLGGINLVFLWNNREDGIWIIPFVLVACIVTIVSVIRARKTEQTSIMVKKLLISLLPIFILLAGNQLVSAINYKYYGVHLRTELDDGNFPRAIQNLYAIAPDPGETETNDRLALPRSTIKKAYSISPTLRSLQPHLDKQYSKWADFDTTPDDGQVENGWFFWCLRSALQDAGYYKSPQAVDTVCGQIADEIESAFKNSSAEKRLTMPSALMAPYEKGFTPKLLKILNHAFDFSVSFKDVHSSNILSESSEGSSIERFEQITGNYALYPDDQPYILSGWLVSDSDQEPLHLAVCGIEGNLAALPPALESEDVYQSFLNSGKDLQNAKQARFHIYMKATSDEMGVVLQVRNSREEVLGTIPLHSNGYTETGKGYSLQIDHAPFANGPETSPEQQLRAIRSAKLCNVVAKFYRGCGWLLMILGIVSYIYLSLQMLQKERRQDSDSPLWNTWLLMTSIMCSLLVLLAGVSYNDLVSCQSINTMYLSGAYPLIIAFWSIGICVSAHSLGSAQKEKKIAGHLK